MGIQKDLWKIFLAKQSITEILKSDKITDKIAHITRDLNFDRFSAESFGSEKDDSLYVFFGILRL